MRRVWPFQALQGVFMWTCADQLTAVLTNIFSISVTHAGVSINPNYCAHR